MPQFSACTNFPRFLFFVYIGLDENCEVSGNCRFQKHLAQVETVPQCSVSQKTLNRINKK